jgi:ParB-like chromosome segregation protein Spo0J
MAASLLAHGQIQSIVVHPADKGFGVAIGATRLEAWQLLAKQKKIASDHAITAEVRPANDPTLAEQSLAENVVRTRMGAADEFEAFRSASTS